MALRHILNLLSDRMRTLPILTLYLTDGCNSRCVTCDIWRNPRRNMAFTLIESIAVQIKPLSIRWIVLSGGEAMQHPEWAAAARLFREQGATVMLLTNGLLLRKQIDDVIASVDEVIVSLDGGTPATYQAIRGVDGFDLILEGIRLARAAGIPVSTRTTIQKANYRELPAIITACKQVGVNRISFLAVDVSNPTAFGDRFQADSAIPLAITSPAEHQPPSSALDSEDVREFAAVLDGLERGFAADFASGLIAESPEKLRRMWAYFGGLIAETAFPPVRCNAPRISAVIEVDGSIRPCFFLPTTSKINTGIAAALDAPDSIHLRQAVARGERRECERCVCPLYKGARALTAL